MSEGLIFDNERVTQLVLKYNANGPDPGVLGEILSLSKTLLAIITSKYSGDIEQEDLMQECRLQLIHAIPKFDPEREARELESGEEAEKTGPKKKVLVYSFFSTVIRNAAVDYVRKVKPADELLDAVEDKREALSELDYIGELTDQLREWFVRRFPTMVPTHAASEVLECVLTDLLDESCGIRNAITNLREDFGFNYTLSKTIYGAVVAQLRELFDYAAPKVLEIPEDSLLPEVMKKVGSEKFQELTSTLEGFAVRFKY